MITQNKQGVRTLACFFVLKLPANYIDLPTMQTHAARGSEAGIHFFASQTDL